MARLFSFTLVVVGSLLALSAVTTGTPRSVPGRVEKPRPGFAKKGGLSLTVSLDKKVYRLGEDITLSFKLKNESDKDLYVGDGYFGPSYQEVGYKRHFEMHLTDENKAQLLFWSDQLTEGKTTGIRKVFRLKPGKVYDGSFYLVASGRKEIQIAGYPHRTQSGTVEDKKRDDRRHELGKHGRRYSLSVVYQVDPKTHGVWQPPKEFENELLWKGALKTSPLGFEITGK